MCSDPVLFGFMCFAAGLLFAVVVAFAAGIMADIISEGLDNE